LKKSYLNIEQPVKLEEADLEKWASTYNRISNLIKKHPNVALQDAIDITTSDWDMFEKDRFSQWLYHTAEPIAYGVKPPVYTEGETQMPEINPNVITPETILTVDDKKLKNFKKELLKRIKLIDGLLDQLTTENLIETSKVVKLREALHELQREVDIIQTFAVLQDRIIRTSNIMKRLGFAEGHEGLIKLGQMAAPALAPSANLLMEALNLISSALNTVQAKEAVYNLSAAAKIMDQQGLDTEKIDAAIDSLMGAYRSAENNIKDAYESARRGGERRKAIPPPAMPIAPAVPGPAIMPAPTTPTIPAPGAPIVPVKV